MSKKLADHALAQLFPMMSPEEKKELTEDIRENGQMDEIITHEGKILDGRNRYEVCLDLDLEPKLFPWEQLPFQQRGSSPFAYVMAHNFKRRNLSASVRAAIAVEALPYYEKEAAERQKGGQFGRLAQKKANRGDEFNQDTGGDPADESQVRGKATAHAARATGTSASSVEKAKRLKESDPEKFQQVKAGKITLSAAEKDEAKKLATEKAHADAIARCAKVCGKAFAAGVGTEYLKGRELFQFIEMNDADMMKCQGLIKTGGWSVTRAKKFKMTALCRTHSIGDLCLRAIAQGGAYSLEGLKVSGVLFDINVKGRREVKLPE